MVKNPGQSITLEHWNEWPAELSNYKQSLIEEKRGCKFAKYRPQPVARPINLVSHNDVAGEEVLLMREFITCRIHFTKLAGMNFNHTPNLQPNRGDIHFNNSFLMECKTNTLIDPDDDFLVRPGYKNVQQLKPQKKGSYKYNHMIYSIKLAIIQAYNYMTVGVVEKSWCLRLRTNRNGKHVLAISPTIKKRELILAVLYVLQLRIDSGQILISSDQNSQIAMEAEPSESLFCLLLSICLLVKLLV
jgi:hypothetical protein